MPWSELFWMLGVLTALTVLGRLWFCAAESLLERAKRLLSRHERLPVWHTLPDKKEEDNGHQ